MDRIKENLDEDFICLMITAIIQNDSIEKEEFKEQLLKEKEEIDEKIERISSFMETMKYKNLEIESKLLLSSQYICMIEYSEILKKRINKVE